MAGGEGMSLLSLLLPSITLTLLLSLLFLSSLRVEEG